LLGAVPRYGVGVILQTLDNIGLRSYNFLICVIDVVVTFLPSKEISPVRIRNHAFGELAHLVEQGLCKAKVTGSNPVFSINTQKYFIKEMKTFKQFQKHFGAISHTVIDPITKKKIRVPKGYSVPVRSRSSAGGNGDSGNGNGE
jgi:hypothetical protein